MKIYDCFSYWDEDLLLNIRLNILNEFVDHFIIVEGNKTWQNNSKKLKFDKSKFKKFANKIIYIPVTDMPDGNNPWIRENYQRNCISKGISEASVNDLIIISDLDEIPNPEALKKFKKEKKYAALKQNHYYYRLNLQAEKNPYWIGSRICIKKYLKSPQWLRNLKFKNYPLWRLDKYRLRNIIEDGGWHFCNLKKPEELLYKYQNLCETNDEFVFNEKINQEYLKINKIQEKISSRKDLIGREENYRIKKIDSSYPKFIIENQEKLKEWIAK